MAEEDKTLVFSERESPSGIPPPYLVIVDGPHKGARFPLKEGANILGRLEECHVVLDDQSVSRKHTEINFSPEGWIIKDLQSKNGTFVNGAMLQEPVVMGHKDLVRIGIYTLRLVTQPLEADEEMQFTPPDADAVGTVLVGENRGGENKEITAPHSPLEDEEAVRAKTDTDLEPVAPKQEEVRVTAKVAVQKATTKTRLMVFSGVLFAVTLAAGLYFYWHFVLSPAEIKKPKVPPVGVGPPPQPQVIPLGPPEPSKPRTIPIFLDCVANPFPAAVRFENKEAGRTPLKLHVDLVPGQQYEIEATFDMPEISEKYTDRLKFSVTVDQSTVPLLFRAPLGMLKITELPRDVSIYLEGYYEYNRFQAKPVKLQNLVLNKPIHVPFGRYVAELRRAKAVGDAANWIEDIIFRREFVLQEDNPTYTLEVTETSLQQFPAEIRSIPSGADVFIDQQKVGQTPFVGTLPVGRHTLTVRKEGYFEHVQPIMADINTPLKTEIVMKTSPAGEKINVAKQLLQQGLYDPSVQALSEIFNLNPGPRETAEARYLLGTIFLKAGDFQKAVGYFEQAKEHDDFKYWAKLGIASVLAQQQQMQEALIPLVEVLLNAKEDAVLREAHGLLRTLSPLRSVVYIQSDPPGATLHLNDKKMEQVTPILLHEMGLGSYRVRLEKLGYQPLELTINLTVNEFNPVFAKLKPVAN